MTQQSTSYSLFSDIQKQTLSLSLIVKSCEPGNLMVVYCLRSFYGVKVPQFFSNSSNTAVLNLIRAGGPYSCNN